MPTGPLDWAAITLEAIRDLWIGFIGFLPQLIGALVIFIVGWLVSVGIGRAVAEVLKRIRFNQLFERGSWKEAVSKAGMDVDPSEFIGAIVKWVLVIVFLLAAVDILGLNGFSAWLREDVLGYLPNVLAAALIIVVAAIVADIAEKVVRTAVEGIQSGYGGLAGSVVKWFIWIFAIFSALLQLNIAVLPIEVLIRSFVQALAYGVALALAIAFGLGGKDAAEDLIGEFRKKMVK